VRRLIALRKATPALRDGAQRSLDASPGVYCFTRERDERDERDGRGARLLVALNFTSEAAPLGLTEELCERATIELSTDPERRGAQLDPRELVLEPDEGLILTCES
jgi:hypothetical protein